MERRQSLTARLRDIGCAQAAIYACAATAITMGLLGMSGWVFASDFLRVRLIEYATLNPATAIALILGGAAIAFTARGRRSWALSAALLVVAIAVAKIADLALGGIPVDRMIFADLLDSDIVPRPSRMAPNTAVALMFGGLALSLLQARGRRTRQAAQLLAMWVMLGASFVIVGHTFSLFYFNRFGTYLPMAKPTAIGLQAIGFAVMALSRDIGLMLVLRDRGPSGAMFRITLPLIIFIPLTVAVLRILGERHGFYGREAGMALQVMGNVMVTSTLLLACAIVLYRSDIARRQQEIELRNSEQFSRLVASANPDCISLLDEDYTVLFANEAILRAYGLDDASQIIGKPYGHLLDDATRADRDAALAAARSDGSGRFTLCFSNASGDHRWYDSIVSRLPDDHNWPFRYMVISRDISEKRQIEDKVRWKASHDDLTKLPNRAQFQTHLDRHVRQAGQEGFALFALDIDNFKTVNDTLGHDAGDRLLETVAERIGRAVRQGDVVARLAGDEFAVIARNVRTEPGAVALAERIFDSLREPWLYQGRPHECRVSIGASLAPRHGDGAEELFKHADIALYEAKARGKGQIAVFRPSMKSAVEKRSRQLSLARHALSRGFIVPYYQPKVELSTGRVAGFEALLRCRHPTQGVQMPGTIAAAFEDLELAHEITERMLAQVLLDMRRWLDRGLPFGHVAINVTAADLRQDNFAERLLTSLAGLSLPHDCLQVEVTETVFLGRGAEYVEKALRQLHDAGIRVALDDFGTGYASLSHLKQFPVDIVKIDRSFLSDFQRDPQNQAIINTVINLGHSLDIEIVAEGIETREQERHLLARNCTYGQGYLYGKAMPALRVPRLLTTFQDDYRSAA
ncbi:putative bifunctional diguanylate cyclase/phosphodiesterase [Novosphingobium sp. JCM 18896]|uniref:putative bifunctional diguanylate cyclase/phosphodiesterase n=1 Tax=Novosphingobium sp. JCM 18896 TaxID=2989731 RepID=UPI002222F653|nr:EAL domain-containing protein [Novosphingobium sp. JCM 18896]MCW1429758.1 EAL domain-containing protein [Novosphingobium sp. JCM 18896]